MQVFNFEAAHLIFHHVRMFLLKTLTLISWRVWGRREEPANEKG